MAVLDVLARAAAASDAVAELSRDVARSVVLVRGSRGSAGSGVIWDRPGLVITNHHVVHGSQAELVIADGVLYGEQGETFAQYASAVGVPAILMTGDGARLMAATATGLPVLRKPCRLAELGDVLRLSITLRPGNSGGALVNARGEVVGIPHLVAGNGMAMAVASRTVARFLSGHTVESEGELFWV